MEVLLKLFYEFINIGLFSYGGGLAILVLLQEKSIELGWLNLKQFADMVAISQSTPGPIAINLATFVGYFQGSILGSVVASIAVILPGFSLSLIVARFMEHFNENAIVVAILKGLRSVVIGLIATAILNIAFVTIIDLETYNLSHNLIDLFDLKQVSLFAIILFLILKFKKHPVMYILGGAVIGLIL